MRRSAFISAAIHAAILLWIVAVFPAGRPPEQVIPDIAVDMITTSELTKIKAGMANATEEAPLAPKEEAPQPKAVAVKEAKADATPPPPPPVEEKQAEKVPEKKPEEAKKPEPVKAEKPKEPEPKKEPPKKAEKKPDKPKPKKAPKTETKRDFNADRIAALLNKIPDAGAEPEANEPVEAPRKPVRGQSNGREATMSVNEIDALRARIAQCWSPPPGGLGADAIIVKLRLQLNEDGSLVGTPSVANSGSSPFFQAAADSAVRAVFQCQPYTLPSDKYAVWRDMILTFDPRQMYSSG